ncbi:MAG: lipoate--protein ligase family protein [Planctomycetota bacterium]
MELTSQGDPTGHPAPIREQDRHIVQTNLDADASLFHAVSRGGSPAWRLYVNPPAVVVGRHQAVEREVNLEAVARYGTPVLKRFTGGGAVYHDEGNLNFAVCEPRSSPSAPWRALYGRYAGWLLRLLDRLGLAGTLTGNRVEVAGGKVTGMAARVGARAIFVHGTLLVASDLMRLREHLRVPKAQLRSLPAPAGPHVLSRPSVETTLSIEAGRTIPVEEVTAEARALLREAFGAGEGEGAGDLH